MRVELTGDYLLSICRALMYFCALYIYLYLLPPKIPSSGFSNGLEI